MSCQWPVDVFLALLRHVCLYRVSVYLAYGLRNACPQLRHDHTNIVIDLTYQVFS